MDAQGYNLSVKSLADWVKNLGDMPEINVYGSVVDGEIRVRLIPLSKHGTVSMLTIARHDVFEFKLKLLEKNE